MDFYFRAFFANVRAYVPEKGIELCLRDVFLDVVSVDVEESPWLGEDPDLGDVCEHGAEEGGAAPGRVVDEGDVLVLGVAQLSR